MQQITRKYPTECMGTDDDVRQYTRDCAGYALVLMVGYVLFLAEIISPLVLFAIVAVTLPRWSVNIHELFHICNDKQINGVIRCLGTSPIPLSFITLSYTQNREIHFAHHRDLEIASAPNDHHIQGNFFVVLLKSLMTPEQRFIRFVAVNGFNLQLGLDLLIKLLVLGILVWFGGGKFFWFWLSLRIVYGLTVLFHTTHHQKRKYRIFELKIPSNLIIWGELIFGKSVIQSTINHDRHHQNPDIALRYLGMESNLKGLYIEE